MKNIISPLIYKQTPHNDYGICRKTGKVYSCKSGSWKPLAEKVSGQNPYPQVGISKGGKKKTICVHVAVHETLNPQIPKPPGVSLRDWQKTPSSVKGLARELFEVNHIDHNRLNFTPSNLEWTTAMQNVQRYQAFRTGARA